MRQPSAWVLVVGEDAAARMALFRSLERAAYHATIADAEQALTLLDEEPYDVVLLDDSDEQRPALEVLAQEALRRHVPLIRTGVSGDLGDPLCVRAAIDAALNADLG
jgi:CheY-like chemotaxis protein